MITDFNSLPMQVERILEEIQALKRIVSKLEKPEEIPKRLTFEGVLPFLATQGFLMSPSKLYKLCSAKKIPHRKFGNRLVFDTKDLLMWCEQQLNDKKTLWKKNTK